MKKSVLSKCMLSVLFFQFIFSGCATNKKEIDRFSVKIALQETNWEMVEEKVIILGEFFFRL